MRKMLEDMGVHIVEADWLVSGAAYIRCEDTLLIRPDADAATWAEVADRVLLADRPARKSQPRAR